MTLPDFKHRQRSQRVKAQRTSGKENAFSAGIAVFQVRRKALLQFFPLLFRNMSVSCKAQTDGRRAGDRRDGRIIITGETGFFQLAEKRPPLPMPELQESILSTAINASLGTCTLPNCRIRFLPSFCFSSNFFFLVISPP